MVKRAGYKYPFMGISQIPKFLPLQSTSQRFYYLPIALWAVTELITHGLVRILIMQSIIPPVAYFLSGLHGSLGRLSPP